MLGGANFKNVRVYWLAFVVSLGMVIFGYNVDISEGVVSQLFFETQYGLAKPNGPNDSKDIVSFKLVSVLQASAIFGALGSAPVSDWLGRRRTLMAFIIIFSVGAMLTTVVVGSHGINHIYATRIISGIGIGGISVVSSAYVSECSPKDVRGRITGLLTIMSATGAMVSSLVNIGVVFHPAYSQNVWRVSFGLQLVPASLMFMGLLTVKESPRWLASMGRTQEAMLNLAYFRKEPRYSPEVRREMAEIEAAVQEHAACKGLHLWGMFFGSGNFIRLVIAFALFFFQQGSGQTSVDYYTPQIFNSIGYTRTKNSLLLSGFYGVFRMMSTMIAVLFFVDTLGRKLSLFISAVGMGVALFVVGAILKTHPVHTTSSHHTPIHALASSTMASMLYLFVCFFSLGVGPIPWIYVSDIFPTRTRHYGLAVAFATRCLFSIVATKITPSLFVNLDYKFFFMFAAINIGGIAVFSIFLPETKGCSLEEVDIIFGAITHEAREAFIKVQERRLRYEHTNTTLRVRRQFMDDLIELPLV